MRKIAAIGLGAFIVLILSITAQVIGLVIESSLIMKISFVSEIISILLAAALIIGKYMRDEWKELGI